MTLSDIYAMTEHVIVTNNLTITRPDPFQLMNELTFSGWMAKPCIHDHVKAESWAELAFSHHRCGDFPIKYAYA